MVTVCKLLLTAGTAFLLSVEANAQQHIRIDLVHTAVNAGNAAIIKPPLAPDAATLCYGFFCRQELKGDKVLPVPVRVRLGSMQQNDWLEQKPNAIAPMR